MTEQLSLSLFSCQPKGDIGWADLTGETSPKLTEGPGRVAWGLGFQNYASISFSLLMGWLRGNWPPVKPIDPKGNQSWIFIGKTDAEAETPNTLATWWEELTHWERPWCWERLKVGREGDDRGWDCWIASPTQWTWVWANSGSSDGQGGLMCCSPWGRKESDMIELLNWTDMN